MIRRPRRSVALAACAAVAFGLPVAVAAPTAQAADPVVHAEWRGWIAYQQEIVASSPPSHMVDRYWSVDVSRTSGDGQWSGNHYRFHNDGCTTTGCCDSAAEGEASGKGDTYGGSDNGVEPGGGINPLEYDSEGGFKFFAPAEGELAGYDYRETCNGTPSYTTGWTQLPHSVDVGVQGSYDDPPVTAAVYSTWSWPDTARQAVACMTRSTVDSDGDGLPDEVDLAPDAAGDPLDLGHPQGSAAWDEEIPSKIGGPSGMRGLPTCSAGSDQPERSVMVSLGDSYASGEGVYGYDPQTDDPGINHCHRAHSAYPRVAFRALMADGSSPLDEVHQLTCSGAKTSDILDQRFCGSGCGADGDVERPQIERLLELAAEPGVDVDVVTVGIGGNDARFGDVVKGCVLPLGNCVAKFDPEANSEAELPPNLIPDVAVKVEQVVRAVRQLAEDDPTVVVVGYPVFISKQYKECPSLVGPGIGADEAEWIRGQILTMNRALEAMVNGLNTEKVRFLSLDTAYGDNVLCNGGSLDTQWVHGPVLHGPVLYSHNAVIDDCSVYNGQSFTVTGEPFGDGSVTLSAGVCNESFHPKAEGHAVTGQALAYCLVSDVCGTASTETVRPAAELAGAPSIDGRDCTAPGIYCYGLPGTPMQVRGEGFKPGSNVSVELHSRPVVLGEATADAAGVVEATVTVPPGTVPPGQHELVLVGPGDDTIVLVGRTPVEIGCGSGFSDVPSDHPFCGDVTWMKSTGVTTGYADGTYRPGIGLSRAQMASFLWRLAGQPVVAASAPAFADVPTDSPHATAVRWLASRAITTGYADGTFKPDVGLSRQHMAAFLHRFADQPASSPSAPTFSDVAADSPFATAISWLAEEGITVGRNDGTFGPGNPLNRQQMAAFLHRFGEPRGLPE